MRLQTSDPDGAAESIRVGMGGAESSDPASKILTTTIHYSTPKGLGEVGGDCPVFGVLGVLAGRPRRDDCVMLVHKGYSGCDFEHVEREDGGDCPIEYVQGFPAGGANGLFRT